MEFIKITEKTKEMLFVLFCFTMFFLWAMVQPYNSCPDENMRYDVIMYVFNKNSLPHGGDPSIRNPMWGFSYAFFPYLSGLVSVFFMKVMSLFTLSEQAILFASRMAIVCFGTACVIYNIKIANIFFKRQAKWFFVVLIGTLPQFVFLSSYLNNDMLAILSVSMMIFYCLEGDRTAWSLMSKIGLVAGVSICILSYYNAYPFIIFSSLYFIWSHVKNKINRSLFIKNTLFVIGMVFFLTGWWFIRNYFLYEGDFLGLKTVENYSNLYAYNYIKPINRTTPIRQGFSVVGMLFEMKWLALTAISSIGVFGYMNVYVYTWIYLFYGAIFCIGLLGAILNYNKINRLYLLMAFPALLTFSLSVYNSYVNGFQPQGRYIMPGLVPIMLLVTAGFISFLDALENKCEVAAAKVIGFICMSSVFISLVCFFGIILPKYGHNFLTGLVR